MTDAEKAIAIDRDRRRREDEALALLFLLFGDVERELTVLVRYGRFDTIQEALAHHFGDRAIPKMAGVMADAHADSFRRMGLIYDTSMRRSAAGPRGDLVKLYTPSARDMSQAMAVSLNNEIVSAAQTPPPPDATPKQQERWNSPKAIVRRAVENAGYAPPGAPNIALGVERNIVLASNVGMLSAALQVSNAEGRGGSQLPTLGPRQAIGLRHISVIDPATTDICLDRHRLTLPADHDYFRWNVPPLHPRCRSCLIPVLPPYEADTVLPSIPPAPGWGAMPSGFLAQFGLAA